MKNVLRKHPHTLIQSTIHTQVHKYRCARTKGLHLTSPDWHCTVLIIQPITKQLYRWYCRSFLRLVERLVEYWNFCFTGFLANWRKKVQVEEGYLSLFDVRAKCQLFIVPWSIVVLLTHKKIENAEINSVSKIWKECLLGIFINFPSIPQNIFENAHIYGKPVILILTLLSNLV